MKKIMGLEAMLLAGLLVLPGYFGLAGKGLAQSDPGAISAKWVVPR